LAKWQPGSDPVTLQTFAAGTLPMDAAAYGGNVYVSLYSGGKVVKCADNGTGTVTDFITARPHPYGLVARAGKLYLADNFTIWEYRISDAGLLNYWTPAPTDTPQFVTDRPGVVCASSVLGNLNPTVDCKVDFKDFAMMASNWLTEGVVVW
jgi:hypothetical protein